LHASLCVCALIPRLETRTRLVLFLHRSEDRKSTNTGRLAAECLARSEVIVRGHQDRPSPPWTCDDGSQPLLLFPFENAEPITRYVASDRPVTLLVPDGTWRQASRVRARVPGVSAIPCVTLPPGPPSVYRLRADVHEGRLATAEAIARAFGVLEGDHVREAIEYVFRAMVERALWARGEIATELVTGGVPDGAERHDPRSGLARAHGALEDRAP
jgi:DTW domain-containing protein YfiP